MGAQRTLPTITISSIGTPTPIFSGPVVNATAFAIVNGLAVIAVAPGTLPSNGYNGPNGPNAQNAATGSKFDINGPNIGAGQQVMLWGFTTGTYFNGKVVTVLGNDGNGSFWFLFNHANVGLTVDAGKTAPIPVENYRRVRIETDQANGATDKVYVGDMNVSSSQYIQALVGPGAVYDFPPNDITNIPVHRLWVDASVNTDKIHVTLVY